MSAMRGDNVPGLDYYGCEMFLAELGMGIYVRSAFMSVQYLLLGKWRVEGLMGVKV